MQSRGTLRDVAYIDQAPMRYGAASLQVFARKGCCVSYRLNTIQPRTNRPSLFARFRPASACLPRPSWDSSSCPYTCPLPSRWTYDSHAFQGVQVVFETFCRSRIHLQSPKRFDDILIGYVFLINMLSPYACSVHPNAVLIQTGDAPVNYRR